MKRGLMSVALMAFCMIMATASADPGDTLWTRVYGGGDIDIANAVIQTRDGGYLMAGATMSTGNGEYDAYLIKTDANGETEWEYTYGDVFYDAASSVQQTTDGGYIVAGFTQPHDTGVNDFYVFRLDSIGSVMWECTYGGAGNDSATYVELTPDGRYIVCGWTDSYESSKDVYVVKVDQDGDGAWTHSSGGVADDGAYCIRPTADGNYIIAGFTGDYAGPDIYIEKIGSTGGTIWNQGYHQGVESRGYSVVEVGAGSYVVAGYVYNNQTNLDALLMKINSTGGIVWSRNYGGDRWEVASCAEVTPDSGFILAGYQLLSLLPDTSRIFLIRTDPAGNIVWQNTIDLGVFSEARSVASTDDGNYIVAGGCIQYNQLMPDIFLAKIQGEFPTSADNNPAQPTAFGLGPIYPNPFNAAATINYYLPSNATISVDIYDILGNRVARLFEGSCAAGEHSLIWNAGGLPSGVFFASMRVGNLIKSEKIVLMK